MSPAPVVKEEGAVPPMPPDALVKTEAVVKDRRSAPVAGPSGKGRSNHLLRIARTVVRVLYVRERLGRALEVTAPVCVASGDAFLRKVAFASTLHPRVLASFVSQETPLLTQLLNRIHIMNGRRAAARRGRPRGETQTERDETLESSG